MKKYVSLSKLSTFLDKLKITFATLSHTHNLSDLTDYSVDAALSDTSANPVQNKVLNEEFDSIATAMNALEAAVDGKAESTHTHSLTDINEVESTTNQTLLGECTSIGSEYISLNSVDFSSLRGKSVTLTVGGTEYEGTCYYDSSYRAYTIDAGDYTIRNLLLEDSTTITPVPASGTTIKLEIIKVATVIPEQYIPETIVRQSDLDGKIDTIDPVFEGSFSQNRNPNSIVGYRSHAEGNYTTASGEFSHAEGNYTTASGDSSHAEGSNTIASGKTQHAQGKFNIEDLDGIYAHIVGNGYYKGEEDNLRSNAHTLDWDGNAWFAGDVYVGSTSGTNKDDGSKKLATESYVDTSISTHNHDTAYDTKGAADTALASAKTYADSVGTTVKNDLLNGAGAAYDTLKELGDLIDTNTDAIEALNTVAAGKADSNHTHSDYETKNDASSKLNEAKSYTDSKFASLANTAYQIGGDEPISGPILWFETISEIN